MPYDCIVLAKQVPDTKNVTGEAMRPDGTVNRGALPAIFNPEDLHALEMALEIRDRFGGTVTVMTMGPPSACEILRESLYRGADRVILLTDRRFAAADTLATSYALSRAVRKVGEFDFIVCGRQAIDGDTAQVGPQTAEKLAINQVTYVEKIRRTEDDAVELERSIEGGFEVLRAPLPLLITVTDAANEPRPPRARRLLQFRHYTCGPELEMRVRRKLEARGGSPSAAEISKAVAPLLAEAEKAGRLIGVWDADAIDAEPDRIGAAGSPTKVKHIESVVLTGGDLRMIDRTGEGIGKLVRELVDDHILG